MNDAVKTFLAFLAYPFIVVYHGWAMTVLWRWSLGTVGIPPIEIAPAIALSALVVLMRPRRIEKDEPPIDVRATAAMLALGPLVLIGIAWMARWVAS